MKLIKHSEFVVDWEIVGAGSTEVKRHIMWYGHEIRLGYFIRAKNKLLTGHYNEPIFLDIIIPTKGQGACWNNWWKRLHTGIVKMSP